MSYNKSKLRLRDNTDDRLRFQSHYKPISYLAEEEGLVTGSVTHDGKRYGYSRLLFALLPKKKGADHKHAIVMMWPEMKHAKPIVVKLTRNTKAFSKTRMFCPSCGEPCATLYSTPLSTEMRCKGCCDLTNDSRPRNRREKDLKVCRRNPLRYTRERLDRMYAVREKWKRGKQCPPGPRIHHGLDMLIRACEAGPINVRQAKTRYWEVHDPE